MPWRSLFPTVKTATLYLVPIKSYSKNTHGHLSLKWTIGSEQQRCNQSALLLIALLNLITDE
jgi:hypothetical protein